MEFRSNCRWIRRPRRLHCISTRKQFDFLHQGGSSHGDSRMIRATYPEEYYTSTVKKASRLQQEAEPDAGLWVHPKNSQSHAGPDGNASRKDVVSSCRQKIRFPYPILDHEWLAWKIGSVWVNSRNRRTHWTVLISIQLKHRGFLSGWIWKLHFVSVSQPTAEIAEWSQEFLLILQASFVMQWFHHFHRIQPARDPPSFCTSPCPVAGRHSRKLPDSNVPRAPRDSRQPIQPANPHGSRLAVEFVTPWWSHVRRSDEYHQLTGKSKQDRSLRSI